MVLWLLPLISLADSVTNLAPVSHWACEETSGVRYDSVLTYTNDLTDNNTVGTDTGIQGTACKFIAGNAEYLSISDASQQHLEDTGPHTYNFWLKMPTLNSSTLFSKWTAQYQSTINSTSLYYDWKNNGGTNGELGITHGLTADTWHMVTIKEDYANSVGKIYIDGTSVSLSDNTQPAGTGIQTGSAQFEIGALSSGGSYSTMSIDEFSVFNRYLTDAEVGRLYNSGSGLCYATCTPPTSTSTASSTTTGDLASTNFGIAIIIVFLSIALSAHIYNAITNKKQLV